MSPLKPAVWLAALLAGWSPLSVAERPAAAPEFTYVALGDSITAGSGARESFVPKLDRLLEQDARMPVHTENLGVPGWRSSDLLRALRTDQAMRSRVRDARFLTVEIGGNDMLAAYSGAERGNLEQSMKTAIAECKHNWEQILMEIRVLRGGNMLGVRTMDLYNPLVGLLGQTNTMELLKPHLDGLNAAMVETAEAQGVTVAHIYAQFNGPDGRNDAVKQGFIAADGIHPSEAGHELIASLLYSAIRK
jgi:lysophospholipase L1-like esterase